MRKANAWICVIEWNGNATQRAKGYCFPPYVFSIQGSKIDTYNTLWYMRPRYFSVWKDIESIYIEHGDRLNGFRMKIEWKNTPSLERKREMDQVTR